MSGTGKYFDGKRPVSIPVTWEIRDDMLILHVVETGARLPGWELKKCRQDVDQNTVFVLRNTETDESLEIQGDSSAIPAHLIQEQKIAFNGKIFAGIIVGIVAVFGIFWVALPTITKYIASHVPHEYEKKASDALFADLGDIKVCTPDLESKRAFDKFIKRVYPLDPNEQLSDLRIDIVKSDPDMENAFTLPGGRIILFQKLIKEARSSEELAGILAHEIGHAKNRHVLQKIIQALGFTAMFQLIGGDFSSALALDPSTVLSIGSLSFDRGMESEADNFSLERLKKSKIDPVYTAEFFKRLPDMGIAIVSTHPGHKERILRFSEKIDFKPEPILTDKEWKALQSYCDVKPKPVRPLFKLKPKPKSGPIHSEPQDDLRSRFQFPQRF